MALAGLPGTETLLHPFFFILKCASWLLGNLIRLVLTITIIADRYHLAGFSDVYRYRGWSGQWGRWSYVRAYGPALPRVGSRDKDWVLISANKIG